MMGFIRNKAKILIFSCCVVVLVLAMYGLHRLSGRFHISWPAEKTIVVSTGTFSGSLSDTLKPYNFSEQDKYQLSRVFSKNIDLKKLKETDEYAVAVSTAGDLKYMSIVKDMRIYSVSKSTAGDFILSEQEMAVKTIVARSSGTVRSSLWETLSSGGVPPDLILDFADIFSWSVDFFTEVRDGDKYTLVYEYKTADNGKLADKKILAAAYEGEETGRKTACYYNKNYYDEKGESLRSFFLRAPLHYRRISSYFTFKRFHPILKRVRPHLGIDYSAPSGTPVSAVAEGSVVYAGWKGGFGRYVEIRHHGNYVTSYGHLRRFGKGIRSGARIGQGDVIGYVGSTGVSTGPHLDFRVREKGRYVNFLKIKYRSSGGLGGKDKETFTGIFNSLLPN